MVIAPLYILLVSLLKWVYLTAGLIFFFIHFFKSVQMITTPKPKQFLVWWNKSLAILSFKSCFKVCALTLCRRCVLVNFNFASNALKKKRKKSHHYEINRGPTGDMKKLNMDSQVSGSEWINPQLTYWNGSATAKISHDSQPSRSFCVQPAQQLSCLNRESSTYHRRHPAPQHSTMKRLELSRLK